MVLALDIDIDMYIDIDIDVDIKINARHGWLLRLLRGKHTLHTVCGAYTIYMNIYIYIYI